MGRDPGIAQNTGASHTPYTRQTHAAASTNARRNTSVIVYPKPTLLTLMVIFTLTLLAFFISLSMQMMNQLFLGQSMGVAIAAVILPLVLSLHPLSHRLPAVWSESLDRRPDDTPPDTCPDALLSDQPLLLLRRTSYPSDTTSRETHVLRGRWLIGK